MAGAAYAQSPSVFTADDQMGLPATVGFQSCRCWRPRSGGLIVSPRDNLKGKRDGALLGLLVGCGLRRAELVAYP